jgi:hypothetical protein
VETKDKWEYIGPVSSRAATMVSGFLFNLLIANLILHELGGKFFATYAAITSIPLLLSFLDLSLGQVVYNVLTDRRNAGWEEKAKSDISRVFYILTFLGIALCTLTLAISFPLNLSQPFDSPGHHNFTSVVAINLTFYFLCIPLNIGFRILNSLGKVNSIIWIQALAPPVTLLGSFLLVNTGRNFNMFIFILPAFATFIVSLLGFFKALTWKYLVKIELKGFGIWFKQEAIPVAFWSTSLTTLSMLMIHFPRFYFLKYGDTESAVSYSYFLLFLLPAQSLIVTYCSVSGPKYRGRNSYTEKITHMRHALLTTVCMSITIGSFLLFTSQLGLSAFVKYLDFSEAKYIWISLILYSLWFVPISSLTEAKSARQFTFDFLFGAIYIIGILSIFRQNSFKEFIEQVYIPANLLIAVLVLLSRSRLLKSEHSKDTIHGV